MAFLNATEMLGGYGETTILNSCTISVNKGEIAVIVGPNGAGKSTAMRAIFGMLRLKKGQIIFDNQDITNLKPQERVGLGMGFVPQTNNVFNSMTVLENLEMGGFINPKNIDKNIEDIFSLFPFFTKTGRRHLMNYLEVRGNRLLWVEH